jgi:8-oxo-dGTP pyrophosphatase MutT (NUDIX family)
MSSRHDPDQPPVATPATAPTVVRSGPGGLVDRLKDGPLPGLAWRTKLGLMRLVRPVTLGVRLIVLDGERVCLVRHGYRPGWFLPGGGVDRDETLEQAAIREAREEAAIAVEGGARFVGMYANFTPAQSDHVALFVAGEWRRIEGARASMEIAETGFFARDALPTGTTPATRRRLAEVLDGAPPTDHW